VANRAHLDVGGGAHRGGATLQVEPVEEPVQHDLWRLAQDFDRRFESREATLLFVSEKPLDMPVHI
jgi:hypothetical protein